MLLPGQLVKNRLRSRLNLTAKLRGIFKSMSTHLVQPSQPRLVLTYIHTASSVANSNCCGQTFFAENPFSALAAENPTILGLKMPIFSEILIFSHYTLMLYYYLLYPLWLYDF